MSIKKWKGKHHDDSPGVAYPSTPASGGDEFGVKVKFVLEDDNIVDPIVEIHPSYEKLTPGEKANILLDVQKWVNKEMVKLIKKEQS